VSKKTLNHPSSRRVECLQPDILRLTLTTDIAPHYLELALNSIFVQLQVEQDAGGSIIKHWKPEQARKTLIPRLSEEEEKQIATLVQPFHSARCEAGKSLEKPNAP
jgi:type I restriction enzyme, S subunit